MIAVFAILVIAGLILFAAFRIVLGWIVSRQTAAKFDRGARAVFKLLFQLGILALAAVILVALWLGFKAK